MLAETIRIKEIGDLPVFRYKSYADNRPTLSHTYNQTKATSFQSVFLLNRGFAFKHQWVTENGIKIEPNGPQNNAAAVTFCEKGFPTLGLILV